MTSKLLKPSTWSVRDSCCRLAGNSSPEMRSQRLLACRWSRKSSATIVAPSSVTSRDYSKMSRRTRPSTATSPCLLVDHPITSRNTARVDPERDGSTRSGRTAEFPGGPVEASDESWSPRSSATAPAGYAITTTTTTIFVCPLNNLWTIKNIITKFLGIILWSKVSASSKMAI